MCSRSIQKIACSIGIESFLWKFNSSSFIRFAENRKQDSRVHLPLFPPHRFYLLFPFKPLTKVQVTQHRWKFIVMLKVKDIALKGERRLCALIFHTITLQIQINSNLTNGQIKNILKFSNSFNHSLHILNYFK